MWSYEERKRFKLRKVRFKRKEGGGGGEGVVHPKSNEFRIYCFYYFDQGLFIYSV